MKPSATVLMAWVVLRVKMISFSDPAWMNSAIDLAGALDPLIGIPFNALGHLFGKPVMASSAAAGGIIRIILVDAMQ